MRNHDDVDVGGHAVEVLLEELGVEDFPDLLVDHVGTRLPLHRGGHAANARIEGDVRHDADLRLLLADEAIDETGQVVFEILLAVLEEKGNDLAAIDHVGADEAKIDLLAGRCRSAGDTLRDGEILGFGQGFGIDDFEPDLAT